MASKDFPIFEPTSSLKLKNVKNKTITITKGKSFTIKAKGVLANSKLKVKVHRGLRFESSNKAIATVGAKTGKIYTKKAGTCSIYVYAQNGVYQKITVKVKKK